MRRPGEIIDIANAVFYLVSDDTKYITRQVIHVAGGLEGFYTWCRVYQSLKDSDVRFIDMVSTY